MPFQKAAIRKVFLSVRKYQQFRTVTGIIFSAVSVIFFYPAAYLNDIVCVYGQISPVEQGMKIPTEKKAVLISGNDVHLLAVIQPKYPQFENAYSFGRTLKADRRPHGSAVRSDAKLLTLIVTNFKLNLHLYNIKCDSVF